MSDIAPAAGAPPEDGHAPPPAADAVPLPPAPAPSPFRFTFTGSAREYFRIWVVNLFLSIVTLGIYSAWAKVRKRRYFYGNTWLDGSNFEYHGDPKAILKGRIIAVAALLAYTLLANFSPRGAAIFLLLMLPAVPWLLLRSFRFNAVNSSWRNLRFHHAGRYRDVFIAVMPVFVFPIAALFFPEPGPGKVPMAMEMVGNVLPVIVLGLAYPFMVARLKRIRVNGSSFGTSAFSGVIRARSFYRIYILAGLVGIVAGMAFGLVVAAVVGATMSASQSFVNMHVVTALGWAAYVATGAVVFAYVQARATNLVFNAAQAGNEVRFTSTLPAIRLALTYFVNLVAIVCTLGFAIPWAAVRVAKLRAEHLAVAPGSDLQAFVSRRAAGVDATGDEMGEMFDFEVAL